MSGGGQTTTEGKQTAVQPPSETVISPPAETSEGGLPASGFGMQDNGDFLIKLGSMRGLRISAADIKAFGRKGIDFTKRPQPIPGLTLEKVTVRNDGSVEHLQSELAAILERLRR